MDNKLEKEARFEARQKEKLEKIAKKPKTKWYFISVILIILLVDILDNFATNTPGNMTSDYITEFLVNGRGMTYESGLSYHNLIMMVSYVMGIFNSFYKSLGDKYGRKPLFVISTLGMTFGLITIFLCKSYFVFILGSCIAMFFLGNDIQILYILEEAPSKHRAKIYSLVKCLGGLSSLLIPTLRATIMHNDSSLWRNVYLLPAVSGIIIVILVILFARETGVFVKERLEYLNLNVEERKNLETEKKEQTKKSGIGVAIKYIFKHPQLRSLLFIKCIFDVAILAVQNYQSIMDRFGMSTAEITQALFFFPIFYCLSVIISGILADKIGRKPTIVIFGSITLVTFILFIIFCGQANKYPVLIGIMYGLYLGGYWIGRDYMEIMATEMVPTEIRSSIIGAFSLLVYSGMAIGYLANTILIGVLQSVWIPSLIITIPAVLVSIILLVFKVKETKGVDYNSIKE